MNAQQQNERTFRRIKDTIAEIHPRGWFVAIADDRIVAAAGDFHELEGLLQTQGRDPRGVLVVEAGIDYPETVTIFGRFRTRPRSGRRDVPTRSAG